MLISKQMPELPKFKKPLNCQASIPGNRIKQTDRRWHDSGTREWGRKKTAWQSLATEAVSFSPFSHWGYEDASPRTNDDAEVSRWSRRNNQVLKPGCEKKSRQRENPRIMMFISGVTPIKECVSRMSHRIVWIYDVVSGQSNESMILLTYSVNELTILAEYGGGMLIITRSTWYGVP